MSYARTEKKTYAGCLHTGIWILNLSAWIVKIE